MMFRITSATAVHTLFSRIAIRGQAKKIATAHWCAFAAAVAVLIFSPSWSVAAERYTALFADGQRAEESEVREWFEPVSQPKLVGKALFDQAAPARWVLDRQQTAPPEPPMFIEFFGGDRLAGEVDSYRGDSGTPYEHLPPHFIVKPSVEVQPPDSPLLVEMRVATEWVRRVVWHRAANDEYRPGTVWLRSGAMLSYRTLRWGDGAITLLTTDGVKDVSFVELAEVHLPKLDPWQCYFDQLAVLSPQLKSRLIQIETSDGSRWTTSTERFQARHYGDRNRPEQWYQLIQPAWSLDPVWLRYRGIRAWRFHAPTDVPLSNYFPVAVKQTSVFGSGWKWRTNQSVQGGLLQSFRHEFGWGFGVQASSELTFEYPEMARSFHTFYGIDISAGSGGCVSISVGPPVGPAWNETKFLTTSHHVVDSGWLALPAGASEQRRIVLRADMAHEGRPAGSDPFDIRDAVNWYEPEVKLDAAALQAEIRLRAMNRVSGLNGWTMSAQDLASLVATNVVDAIDPKDPSFRLVVRSADKFVICSRKVKVGAQHKWLCLVASRFAQESTPTFVQVKVDGRSMGEFEVPIRQSLSDPDPILVPIEQHRGRTVNVDIVVYGSDEKSFVDWRGFTLVNEHPGILTIFEDDPKFVGLLNKGTGSISIDDDKPYSGKSSIRVTPDAGDNPQIPGLEALITDQPKLGEYRYVLFAWKQPTGTRLELELANNGRLGEFVARKMLRTERLRGKPARAQNGGRGGFDDRGMRHGYSYDAGSDRQSAGSPLRLNGALPKEWQALQRDLYSDFGMFTLTGLALRCLDGESAWFDHLYLARTPQDMEQARVALVNPTPARPAADPSVIDFAAKRDDYGRLLAPFTSQFATLDLGHGLYRMKEHLGHVDVLRTHPNAQDKPAILRTGMVLPANQPMVLDLLVSHAPTLDWQLVVKANGEVIHDELINDKLTLPQRGFASIRIPLRKFAGQKVYLEVLNQSNNWSSEYAYWKRIDVVEE